MKNQNDLIFGVVAIVLALIVAGVFYGIKKEPQPIAPIEEVVTTPAVVQGSDVRMADALPAGNNQNGMAGGLGGGSRGGPAAGGGPGRPSAAGVQGGTSGGGGSGPRPSRAGVQGGSGG